MYTNTQLLFAFIGVVSLLISQFALLIWLGWRISRAKNDQLYVAIQLENVQKQQREFQTALHAQLQNNLQHQRQQWLDLLQHHGQSFAHSMEQLTQRTQQQLQHMSGLVEQRLVQGFEKSTATFVDIMKRLTLIDEAQKKITELSSHVVNLQQLLSDKRSRGVFGEVQLNTLISNVLPASHYALQHTLSNGKRADCILFLPPPTGSVVIDAKFPLENYQRMIEAMRQPGTAAAQFEAQFRQDVQRHITSIAEKYILPPETAEGAILFLPAEAVFAEIHARFPEVVENAYRARVWLASPTTLMAILTTARAVLKDEATRAQVHIIQQHLHVLAKDFERFQQRMDHLAKHIQQAHEDVQQVNTSARKITTRFQHIERVDLGTSELAASEILSAAPLMPEVEAEIEAG